MQELRSHRSLEHYQDKAVGPIPVPAGRTCWLVLQRGDISGGPKMEIIDNGGGDDGSKHVVQNASENA